MAKKKTKLQEEIEDAAIAIVNRERTNWEESVSFITPQVGFRMRELIRILRKNYWGVFDEPIDKNTGREKVWIGLAMSTAETWVKNTDIDQKDIGFLSRTSAGQDITELTRLVVRDYLDRQYFGEILDKDERQLCIDGTLVWKTWETSNGGLPVMNRRTVDLLNFYIDPTEDNIQSAYRVTERAILLPEQIAGMSGWWNTDEKDMVTSTNLNRNDGNRRANSGTRMTGGFRDAWETWGKIPKWLTTGDKKAEDAYDEVDGHLVVSGFEAGGPTCHLVELNKKKDKFGHSIKPYEECWASKVTGRWYGLGPVERILALQEYLNIVVNIRINRSYVSQLGLFKIKKGKGITAQMLSRLPVNGAIQVGDMDDIQNFTVNEPGATSYQDEDVIKFWAQQMSGAFPISTGEIMPSSASATASSIASSSSKSGYTIFKESIGSFIERWIDRQALPIIAKTVSIGDIVRLGNADERFKALIETIAINNVSEALEDSHIVPSEEELLAIVAKEEEKLRKQPQVFIKNIHEILAESLDTRVHVTNEDLDTSVTIANLIQMMQLEQQDPAAMLETKKQIYELMGLEMPKPHTAGTPQQVPGTVPPPSLTPPTLTGLTQAANAPGPLSNR